MAGKVHGLVKDAGDFDVVPTHSIENHVFGDSKRATPMGQIVSGFTAGEDWVVHDGSLGDREELKISGSLVHSPGFDGVAKDSGKVPFCEFR